MIFSAGCLENCRMKFPRRLPGIESVVEGFSIYSDFCSLMFSYLRFLLLQQ